MSRLNNVKSNLKFGVYSNFLSVFISFITRTIFIYTLGEVYLGLNGLFTNILGVLSLADLGIGNAITFSLYKPISENDERKIGQIMSLFGSAYKIIGLCILFMGSLLIPFLHVFVNFSKDIDINYHLIYILFLLNSVFTYLFFTYKSTVIYASQKGYAATKYEIKYTILTLLLQIFVLSFFKNYYFYLIIPIIMNILKNYKISVIANEMFPILCNKKHDKLEKSEKKEIIRNIYSISMFKISSVIYNSTDDILISSFISTIIVGYYSNYMMVINIVKNFLSIIFNSVTASIGDINVSESDEYKYNIFQKLNTLNFILYSFCFINLYFLINPFIEIWIGRQYILEKSTVMLICLSFLITGLNNVINIYKDACGLFWETRYRALMTAIVNLISSLVLVNFIGISGVLLGTILAYIITIYTIDPVIVFKKVFHRQVKEYYISLIKNLLIICSILLIIRFIYEILQLKGFISIIVGVIINTIIFIIIIYLCKKKEIIQIFCDVRKERKRYK